MSANRLSWIVVALVVVLVGVLVYRTVQHDAATRSQPPARAAEASSPGGEPVTRTDSVRPTPPGGRQPSSVENAKLELKRRGYFSGPINSNYDPVLADALKRFQKDQGLKPTGYLDPKTYAALGIEVKRKRD